MERRGGGCTVWHLNVGLPDWIRTKLPRLCSYLGRYLQPMPIYYTSQLRTPPQSLDYNWCTLPESCNGMLLLRVPLFWLFTCNPLIPTPESTSTSGTLFRPASHSGSELVLLFLQLHVSESDYMASLSYDLNTASLFGSPRFIAIYTIVI
jgi:hypothetical protein